jgi:serine/threonine protein phosphatase 1
LNKDKDFTVSILVTDLLKQSLMGRALVLGDVHGAYRALVQVMDASHFNPKSDRLICLGDVSDRWPEVSRCFDELLKVRDLIYILGNHDWWLLQWFIKQEVKEIWIEQGGSESIHSYLRLPLEERTMEIHKHRELLEKALHYYIDEDNRLFVHGGFDWNKSISEQNPRDGEFSEYTWNRNLLNTAWRWHREQQMKPDSEPINFGDFKDIFIGHTSTAAIDPTYKPVHLCNLWALDQGAGWGGKLTLMDVDTKEYWQSDKTISLYA